MHDREEQCEGKSDYSPGTGKMPYAPKMAATARALLRHPPSTDPA
jgi:hypothetical protein